GIVCGRGSPGRLPWPETRRGSTTPRGVTRPGDDGRQRQTPRFTISMAKIRERVEKCGYVM
ncbi:hypothetical protein, partial [Desulfosporosinus metallidurans]|uniref:hypothetical protein n=1 Tax=Desulfosporosinus metallidurans TaxID=1888891 RepID=UPI001A9A5B80